MRKNTGERSKGDKGIDGARENFSLKGRENDGSMNK
jgi:hypothetical protein